MIATFALIGLLALAPQASAGALVSIGDADVSAAAGNVHRSQVHCFDASPEGLFGTLQTESGAAGTTPAPHEEEWNAAPADCALV